MNFLTFKPHKIINFTIKFPRKKWRLNNNLLKFHKSKQPYNSSYNCNEATAINWSRDINLFRTHSFSNSHYTCVKALKKLFNMKANMLYISATFHVDSTSINHRNFSLSFSNLSPLSFSFQVRQGAILRTLNQMTLDEMRIFCMYCVSRYVIFCVTKV